MTRKNYVVLNFEGELPIGALEKICESTRFLTTQEIEPIDVFEGKYKEVSERSITVSQKKGGRSVFYEKDKLMMYCVHDKAEIDTSPLGATEGGIKLSNVASKIYTQKEVDELRRSQTD
jgi:hypothetical protein|tara:strand:+ start:822 stop:1178 length:357 start_codon:yes stop_codon:yes gene_type:complete